MSAKFNSAFKLILTSTLLFFYSCVFSQENSVLWKIEHPKTNKVSYLLGSIHTLNADSVLKKFPVIKKLIENADVFYSESGIKAKDSNTSNFFKFFEKQPPKKFEQWFGKNSHKVDSFFSAFEKEINYKQAIDTCNEKLNQLYLVIGMFATLNDSLKFGNLESVYDNEIQNIAQGYKKQIKALDNKSTVKKVIDNELESIFPDFIISLVNESIAYRNKDSAAIKKTMSYIMKKYTQAGTYNYPTNKDKPDSLSFTVRNKQWIKILAPALKEKSAMIVVGIDHITPSQKNGLVNLLKREGFKITPVFMKPNQDYL